MAKFYNEENGIYYIDDVATTLDQNGNGWDTYSNGYYLGGTNMNLDQNGSGYDGAAYYNGSAQPTGWNDYYYYINNVETTLDQNGTGSWGNLFYINSQQTSLDTSGNGYWNSLMYSNGTLFSGYLQSNEDYSLNAYYIEGVETTLNSSGNGTWNGQTYVNGVVQGGGGGSVNLESGLQAFYKLSDTSDSSGNNRTLTNNGNGSFVSGKLGNCFQAAGAEGYLSTEFDASSWTEFSLSFWAKVTAEIYPNIIYQMDVTGPNNMPLGYVEGLDWRPFGYSHGDTAVLDEWVHWTIAAKSLNGVWSAIIYKNGAVLPCPDLDANGFTPVINGIKIGTSGEMQTSNMQIDAFGIWSRELRNTEAAALYNSGNGLELGTTPTLNTLTKIQGNAKFYGKVKFAL
jgi:hypothetical protein